MIIILLGVAGILFTVLVFLIWRGVRSLEISDINTFPNSVFRSSLNWMFILFAGTLFAVLITLTFLTKKWEALLLLFGGVGSATSFLLIGTGRQLMRSVRWRFVLSLFSILFVASLAVVVYFNFEAVSSSIEAVIYSFLGLLFIIPVFIAVLMVDVIRRLKTAGPMITPLGGQWRRGIKFIVAGIGIFIIQFFLLIILSAFFNVKQDALNLFAYIMSVSALLMFVWGLIQFILSFVKKLEGKEL